MDKKLSPDITDGVLDSLAGNLTLKKELNIQIANIHTYEKYFLLLEKASLIIPDDVVF